MSISEGLLPPSLGLSPALARFRSTGTSPGRTGEAPRKPSLLLIVLQLSHTMYARHCLCSILLTGLSLALLALSPTPAAAQQTSEEDA